MTNANFFERFKHDVPVRGRDALEVLGFFASKSQFALFIMSWAAPLKICTLNYVPKSSLIRLLL